jgi:hypothetical protein
MYYKRSQMIDAQQMIWEKLPHVLATAVMVRCCLIRRYGITAGVQ